MPDERKDSATAFLARALAWFAGHGVKVERIMTDNGSAYRSHDFAAAPAARGLRHNRTRPYTPTTNGRAERFIQSSLREWAYARSFRSSDERSQAMQPWITDYNHRRPHAALGGKPPISRTSPRTTYLAMTTSSPGRFGAGSGERLQLAARVLGSRRYAKRSKLR